MTRVEQEVPNGSEARALFALADAGSLLLYPGEHRTGLSGDALLALHVRFFMARHDGRAVGCGGYVPLDGTAVELKRLFVHPDGRGQGIGRALLAAMENLALLEGFRTVRLEMGFRAEAAATLYRSAGYADAPPFGPHADDLSSRFRQKSLHRPSSPA